MASPEFQVKLQKAHEFRRAEAAVFNLASKADRRDYLTVLRENPNYQEARRIVSFDRWEKLAARVPEFSAQDWETAGRVFSGINNGVKAGLLLEIAKNTRPATAETGPGTYTPIDDIYDRFKDLFAGSSLLDTLTYAKGQVFKYCQDSLCNVGQVVADYNIGGELVGFGITQDGIQFGVPASLLILWRENKENQSVFPIIGPTYSGGNTRAPFNRLRLIDHFVRYPFDISLVDAGSALGVTWLGNFGEVLNHFQRLGLIEYSSIHPHTAIVEIKYESDPRKDLRQAPIFRRQNVLQKYIIGVLNGDDEQEKSQQFSISDIFNKLPEEIKRRRKEQHLLSAISSILSSFAREGFLSRVDNFIGAEKQSSVFLTKAGRNFFMTVVLPVLSIISGHPLTESQQARMHAVQQNMFLFARTSAELYYPYSTSSKKRASKGMTAKILEVLLESSEPVTNNDLARRLDRSARNAGDYLKPKIKGSDNVVIKIGEQAAIIDITWEKGVKYYKLRNPQDFLQE